MWFCVWILSLGMMFLKVARVVAYIALWTIPGFFSLFTNRWMFGLFPLFGLL